jgi:dolichyl-phosphate beta-glucosyltransferase
MERDFARARELGVPPPTPKDSVPERSLSVVIPAYNEGPILSGTLGTVQAFLQDSGYKHEILVVDDGSQDDTRQVALSHRASCPTLRVLGYSTNRGKGYAVATGILAAVHPAILFSDADLSTPIAEIERLWPWYDCGYDVVIASRQAAQAEILARQPHHRELMGRAFNKIVALLGVRGFSDTQCGFKLFRAAAGRAMFSRLKTAGFAFDVELLIRARRAKFRVAEVGVRWRNGHASKVRPVTDSARMLLEILRMQGFW